LPPCSSSPLLLRQIVVGVERLRVFLGLGVEPAIFDHQVDGIVHVGVGDLERPLAFGFGGPVQRDGQLKTLRQGVDLAAFWIGVEDGLRRRLRILFRRFTAFVVADMKRFTRSALP
jgi:hypothetical protein